MKNPHFLGCIYQFYLIIVLNAYAFGIQNYAPPPMCQNYPESVYFKDTFCFSCAASDQALSQYYVHDDISIFH